MKVWSNLNKDMDTDTFLQHYVMSNTVHVGSHINREKHKSKTVYFLVLIPLSQISLTHSQCCMGIWISITEKDMLCVLFPIFPHPNYLRKSFCVLLFPTPYTVNLSIVSQSDIFSKKSIILYFDECYTIPPLPRN